MECKDGVCFMKPKGSLSLAVFEVTQDAVMLEWTPRTGFEKFQVDIKEGQDAEWRTLSDSLTSSFMRKKNLVSGAMYEFRVRGLVSGKWSEFSAPFGVKAMEHPPMPAPVVTAMTAQDDGKSAAMITWTDVGRDATYEVQMRRMQGSDLGWRTLSDKLKTAAVKKKNLDAAPDYVFRVRAQLPGETSFGAWSFVSKPAATASVSSQFSSMFGDTLLRKGPTGAHEKVSTSSLGGKIVLVYFSAHWCPPCRQQTTMMQQYFPALAAKGVPVEIVFISADRDQHGFNEYFGSMPWLALPFDSPRRQQLMSTYQVNGIPKLMVFSPSGRIISDNAAGAPLTEQLVNSWRQQA